MPESILLIETNPDLRRVISLSLQQQGFRILEVIDVAQAYEILKKKSPELLILELDIPNGNNGALIEAYRRCLEQDTGNGKVILTTTLRPGDAWRRRYKPDAVIYKPFDVRRLCDLVKDKIQSKSVRTM